MKHVDGQTLPPHHVLMCKECIERWISIAVQTNYAMNLNFFTSIVLYSNE
jgi:hypothetical protein